MVKVHLAHTSLINPPGSASILTQPQIWAGLQRKIRFAQEFVPVIESCTVLSEDQNMGTVTRDVRFKKGQGPKEQAREIVKSYYPAWVEFIQEDGSTVRNIISEGEEGFCMTYAFEFDLPDLQEGTEELGKEVERLKAMGKMAVGKSIETIREMVRDGRIEK